MQTMVSLQNRRLMKVRTKIEGWWRLGPVIFKNWALFFWKKQRSIEHFLWLRSSEPTNMPKFQPSISQQLRVQKNVRRKSRVTNMIKTEKVHSQRNHLLKTMWFSASCVSLPGNYVTRRNASKMLGGCFFRIPEGLDWALKRYNSNLFRGGREPQHFWGGVPSLKNCSSLKRSIKNQEFGRNFNLRFTFQIGNWINILSDPRCFPGGSSAPKAPWSTFFVTCPASNGAQGKTPFRFHQQINHPFDGVLLFFGTILWRKKTALQQVGSVRYWHPRNRWHMNAFVDWNQNDPGFDWKSHSLFWRVFEVWSPRLKTIRFIAINLQKKTVGRVFWQNALDGRLVNLSKMYFLPFPDRFTGG